MIPVSVIGGYLGAGKTTLINTLLRHNGGLRLAIMVNEFGELPIDNDLIQNEEEGLITLAGGCVCCSFGSDLKGALDDLARRNIVPDHILIEASGVAIPSSITGSVSLMKDYQADATIVLADVDQIRQNAAHKYIGDTILRQLADADLVIMTKTDLADKAQINDTEKWLSLQAPKAQIIAAQYGNIPISAVLDPFIGQTRGAGSSEKGHGDNFFASTIIDPSPVRDVEQFACKLAQHHQIITRAKGFVQDTENRCFLIQVVGQRWEITPMNDVNKLGVAIIGPKDTFDLNLISEIYQAC